MDPPLKILDPSPGLFEKSSDPCSKEEIDPSVWNLQCEDDNFALFCSADGQEKKCACRKGEKYFYTYGAKCADLPCFHKVCS